LVASGRGIQRWAAIAIKNRNSHHDSVGRLYRRSQIAAMNTRGVMTSASFDGATGENAIKSADNIQAITTHINSLIEIIREIEGYEESSTFRAA
jgi:hypothetical protein